MFWVVVAILYFLLAAVAPAILGLFVNRARPDFRALTLSLRIVFVVIALICLAAAQCATAAEADPRFDEARVHFQRGRVAEALETYDKLAEDKIDPTRVAIGKSRCLEFRGDWKEKRSGYSQAYLEPPAKRPYRPGRKRWRRPPRELAPWFGGRVERPCLNADR